MFKKEYLFLTLFFIFLLSCQNDDPVQPSNFAPILKNFTVPDTIFTQINQGYIVSVQVEDKNGLDDIATVKYEIFNPQETVIEQGDFFDDGDYDLHGNIIANNGTYSQRLKTDFPDGTYRLIVQATDKSELESDPVEKSFYAKAGVVNNAPTLSVIEIPDSVYVDKVVPFILKVRAEDEDSSDYVSKVSYQILGPTISDLAQEGELFDDGSSGDQTAGDGIFSIETTTEFASWKFGSYHIFITAYDSKQKASESIFSVLPWAKLELGVAPEIYDMVAPDTLKRPSSGDISQIITIKASDPDNDRDVKYVFFFSMKPDSTYANNGNPIFLYDDGDINGYSNDSLANDMIYSVRLFMPDTAKLGKFQFEFQARDYSDLLSNKIIHTITVIE